jgi:myo-inositol 2-dehydrogenase / D-chiro-inositol 1-dehydrogenase
MSAARVVLCGLGRAGRFHLQSMRLLGAHRISLACVVDINTELCDQVAQEYQCGKASSLEEALANHPDIDMVIVASTTDTHYQLCKTALEAKKALFTEKPISHHPEEVKHICELATNEKLPFFVGYQRRCDRNFRQLRNQLIEDNAIGQPRIIRCTSRDNPVPSLAYLATSGGIFHDMLSHDFDMLNYLTQGGIPRRVYTIATCYDPEIKKMNDVDTVVVTLEFESGLLATVDTSRVAAYGYDQRVEVFGEHGMLTAENEVGSTVTLANGAGYHSSTALYSFPQRYKQTYTDELDEFIRMATNEDPSKRYEPPELVLRHIQQEKIAAAAELSWRIGRAVLIDEVDELRHHLTH